MDAKTVKTIIADLDEVIKQYERSRQACKSAVSALENLGVIEGLTRAKMNILRLQAFSNDNRSCTMAIPNPKDTTLIPQNFCPERHHIVIQASFLMDDDESMLDMIKHAGRIFDALSNSIQDTQRSIPLMTGSFYIDGLESTESAFYSMSPHFQEPDPASPSYDSPFHIFLRNTFRGMKDSFGNDIFRSEQETKNT